MSQEIKICSADSGCFLGGLSAADTIYSANLIQGACIVKDGGTSAQFLKADGSVDSNTYSTCQGDVTGIDAGTAITVSDGGTSTPTVGVTSACNTAWNANTTCTGTTTPTSTETFTNKSGNISQWTNDCSYISTTGTACKLTKFNAAVDNIEDSIVTESSSLITVAGAIDVDNICSNDGSNNIKYGLSVGAGGIANVGIGCCASNAMTTGFNNIAIGPAAMKAANGVCCNVAIGVNAAEDLSTGGDDNVAIGTGAMLNATTEADSVAIGKNSIGSGIATGRENVAIGLCASYSQTTGTNNVVLGDCSNSGGTTGSYNVSIGSQAGFYALSGDHNVAMGQYALYDNWGGDYNTAIGTAAMQCTTTGSNNAAVGYRAMMNNTTGNDNFAVGECALQSNVNGIGNTALGHNAFGSNVTGNYTVAIGDNAGTFQSNGCNTLSAASDSIYIGRNTKGKDNNDSNSIVIGYNACSCGQNTIKLGNNAITAACIHVAWTVISDERDKTDIADLGYGLDFIGDLQPKAFKYRNSRTTTANDGVCRYGFLAQDIQETEDGDKVIVNEDNSEQYGINTDYIVPILVNAVKDLKARVEALEA